MGGGLRWCWLDRWCGNGQMHCLIHTAAQDERETGGEMGREEQMRERGMKREIGNEGNMRERDG